MRHSDLARSRIVHALFAVRTLPSRLVHGPSAPPLTLRIDDLTSSEDAPGFQILSDADHEVVVGAIGKVWMPDIPFVHVPDAAAYAAFDEPGYVKVAWALRVTPLGERDARVTCELRVDATDEAAWASFRRYFRLIGPGSRFIRRALFGALARASRSAAPPKARG